MENVLGINDEIAYRVWSALIQSDASLNIEEIKVLIDATPGYSIGIYQVLFGVSRLTLLGVIEKTHTRNADGIGLPKYSVPAIFRLAAL